MELRKSIGGATLRLILAIVAPFVALALQLMFWPVIKPFAWFLFFPTVFFSSWISGMAGGVISTILSTGLVLYFFIPPESSFAIEDPFALGSIILFVIMGVLFGYSHERIRKATRATADALGTANAANEQLQCANEQITHLYEKTREIDRLKTAFFANVSHELRTPLTLILGPVAKRLSVSGANTEEHRDLEVVDRNARLLYRHVNDLLDVAKLEAGRMQMHYAEVDLANVTRMTSSHFEALAAERGIQYLVNSPEHLTVQIDVEKIQRILLNLLSNAFKFSPAAGTVALTLSTMDGCVSIQVQDNGPGVPESMREAIFEHFRQIEGEADRRFGGTGLGLSIVKEFVELHGGSIEITDAPEGGALFTVWLPGEAPEGTDLSPAPTALDAEMSRQTLDELRPQVRLTARLPSTGMEDAPLILVVEDNPDMNAFLVDSLQGRYRVVFAFDGQAGLKKSLEVKPDLILSDVMMPGMSGDRMVELLRKHRELDDVPIVMLTAKADDNLRVRLLRKGVQDYICKPFSGEELQARIDGLIGDRKHSSERLHKSEERYRHTLDAMLEGYQIIGSDWRYLYLNSAAEKHNRRPNTDLLGKVYREMWPGIETTKVYSVMQRCMLERMPQTLENEFTYPDGGKAFFDLVIYPVQEGIVVHSIDRTERQRAVEAMRESEMQFRAMFELASIGIAQADPRTGRWVRVNQKMCEITGYSGDEMLGMRISEITHPEDRTRDWEAFQRVVNMEDPQYRIEKRYVRKDGSLAWVNVNMTVIRDSAGEAIRTMATIEDITDRKNAEQEILNLNADLERRVDQRTTELADSNKELEAFTYSVSHDLRAPLRAIDGFSRIILEDYASTLDAEGQRLLGIVRTNTQQMDRLITDLLTLSRTSRTGMRTSRIDMTKLVRSIYDEVASPEIQKRIEFCMLPLPEVSGDSNLLHQIWQNLLSNAVKYSSTVEAPRIEVGGYRETGGITYFVKDNGVGFNSKYTHKLFGVFQRLHKAEEFEGTGIGLAIVQRIVHRHGGRVWAEGAVNAGAAFYFLLPERGDC